MTWIVFLLLLSSVSGGESDLAKGLSEVAALRVTRTADGSPPFVKDDSMSSLIYGVPRCI